MQIKKHIPNLLTLLNLFSGCIALVFAFNSKFEYALLFVALGIFFDFFDGFFARLFNVSGPLGLQLDSLADMVTSGVVPGVTMFFLMQSSIAHGFNDTAPMEFLLSSNAHGLIFCSLGFVITLGACFRLAKFNIDTRQTNSFIGLPTPANALFILSLPLVKNQTNSLLVLECLINPYFLVFITLLSAYIMNAEIPLFSLKIKKFSLKENGLQLIFLAISLLLLIFLQFTGIPLIILLYVLLSIANNTVNKSRI